MADRDLKLNSLARYAKTSPDLVLEEWSHCEIPAGCGGAVLRWWNPKLGLPVTLWVHVTGRLDFRLDGRPLTFAVPLMTFGTHVLTFSITRVDSKPIQLMVAALARADTRSGTTGEFSPQRTVALSASDGSWKYSRVEPVDEAWMGPAFDDSGWEAMEAGSSPITDDRSASSITRLERFGARPLSPRAAESAVWVRRVLVLSEAAGPELPERSS